MEHPHIKLKPKTRVVFREWFFIIVSTIALFYAYYIIAWWGLSSYMRQGIFNGYMESGYIHLEIIVQGVIFGLLFGLINYLIDNSMLRRKSFGALILIRTSLYMIAVIFSALLVIGIYDYFYIMSVEMFWEMKEEFTFPVLLSVWIYLLLIILFINFLLQINRKFGHGVLLSMITGKYHKPRNEFRIFMFLDMKNSTGHAQRLGHYNYSRLIQTCIHDLTDIIMRYKAHVYQYVGDEVVLTWSTKQGVKNFNCINLYYAFEQRLRERRDYYEKHYDTIPEFKAGLDEGPITVTEVGDIKREIAYHGDVLHTAARLEKMCNNLEKKVLITQRLLSMLPSEDGFEMEFLGEFHLRGKKEKEKVFGINRMV